MPVGVNSVLNFANAFCRVGKDTVVPKSNHSPSIGSQGPVYKRVALSVLFNLCDPELLIRTKSPFRSSPVIAVPECTVTENSNLHTRKCEVRATEYGKLLSWQKLVPLQSGQEEEFNLGSRALYAGHVEADLFSAFGHSPATSLA
jgi:hypothetical protein